MGNFEWGGRRLEDVWEQKGEEGRREGERFRSGR